MESTDLADWRMPRGPAVFERNSHMTLTERFVEPVTESKSTDWSHIRVQPTAALATICTTVSHAACSEASY